VLQLWPLPAIYLGNVIFGLGGTKKLRYLLEQFLFLSAALREYIFRQFANCDIHNDNRDVPDIRWYPVPVGYPATFHCLVQAPDSEKPGNETK